MILLCCAKSTRGKSTLVKKIIEQIQPKNTPYLIIIITDHPDEDFGDLKVRKNTSLQLLTKKDLKKSIDIIFQDVLTNIYKLIFVDDATALEGKHSEDMQKLFTQARHQNCDVIFANHYINSFNCSMKPHITDFAIWGPVSQKKLEEFYTQTCSDNLDCTAQGHEMNYEIFKKGFFSQVQRTDIPRDSIEQEQFYHNFMYLSFPTVYDKTSQVMFNDFTLKNSVLNPDYGFKDKKLTEEEQKVFNDLVIEEQIKYQEQAIKDPIKYVLDKNAKLEKQLIKKQEKLQKKK